MLASQQKTEKFFVSEEKSFIGIENASIRQSDYFN